jgi:hypothetical protein
MLLEPISGGGSEVFAWRIQIDLLGVKNGGNPTFYTPDYFLKSGYLTIKVYWNGRCLAEGIDFEASEPGGAGTGWRTITLLWTSLLPRANDELKADYLAA